MGRSLVAGGHHEGEEQEERSAREVLHVTTVLRSPRKSGPRSTRAGAHGTLAAA
ncbi:hypothetical protein DB32_006827 [Sandaracinus amylolyticus]|uniref:Uncharacterized protein n=1 Tax=Sandaracinus amylolyticus TaxID=927083 RepID=A0A0F6YLB4_9BACT|nr:hypothetical protein DB32_006827 [Sandaracinus amylolyticus]